MRGKCAIVLAAAITVACGPAGVTTTPPPSSTTPAVATTAAPTATPTPVPSTAAPTATQSATPAPTATALTGPGRYASAELGYSVDLAPGWRRAVCSPGVSSVNPVEAAEFFVDTPEAEEQILGGTPIVVVNVLQSQGRTAEGLLQTTAQQPDVKVERVTLNGREAARAYIATNNVTYAYAIAARGWLYKIERPYFGTDDAVTRQLISSLRVLDDATLGRAPTPSPAARSIEAVADALVAAFAKKDVAAIGEAMEPCVTVAAVPGDGGSVSRTRYLQDLRTQFTAGTSVQVRARPIEDGPYGRFVISTWSRSGQPDQRTDIALRARGERWAVTGFFYRLAP